MSAKEMKTYTHSAERESLLHLFIFFDYILDKQCNRLNCNQKTYVQFIKLEIKLNIWYVRRFYILHFILLKMQQWNLSIIFLLHTRTSYTVFFEVCFEVKEITFFMVSNTWTLLLPSIFRYYSSKLNRLLPISAIEWYAQTHAPNWKRITSKTQKKSRIK